MEFNPKALVTPDMVRDHRFPSRELRVPHCFHRWTFQSPSSPPPFSGLMPLVGVTVREGEGSADAFLPVIHFAALVELCRYRMRCTPSRLADSSTGNKTPGCFFPRAYKWDLSDHRGGLIMWDVRRLWWASRDLQRVRSAVIATAALGWKAGNGITLPAYQGNLWGLLDLADTAQSLGEEAIGNPRTKAAA